MPEGCTKRLLWSLSDELSVSNLPWRSGIAVKDHNLLVLLLGTDVVQACGPASFEHSQRTP